MIAKNCKGDFDTYFFVIDNFIKHANAKGYNRHVATGAMQPSQLLSVGIPSNVKPAKTKYMNPGQKKMPWKSEGMEQYNQLHEEVHQD
jgi:hypothetical protein